LVFLLYAYATMHGGTHIKNPMVLLNTVGGSVRNY